MKEILFKAKRVDNGEWVEGCLIYFDNDYRIVDSYLTDSSNCISMMCAYIVAPSTICRYTGLINKNGQKIWENDIIEDHGRRGIVRFGKYEWYGTQYGFYIEWERDRYLRPDVLVWVDRAEVVGNVFDNNSERQQDKKGDKRYEERKTGSIQE